MSSGSKTAHKWRHLPAVSKTIIFLNVHIELCTLQCIKTAFLFSLWPHMHLNMINLASVYHCYSRN